MVTIYIEPTQKTNEMLYLVRAAVESEIAQLELALKMALRRLSPFEQKYGVSSLHFITTMVAEDLEGSDDEYVCWAGEYKLMERLQEKLNKLKEINYRDTSVFHSN